MCSEEWMRKRWSPNYTRYKLLPKSPNHPMATLQTWHPSVALVMSYVMSYVHIWLKSELTMMTLFLLKPTVRYVVEGPAQLIYFPTYTLVPLTFLALTVTKLQLKGTFHFVQPRCRVEHQNSQYELCFWVSGANILDCDNFKTHYIVTCYFLFLEKSFKRWLLPLQGRMLAYILREMRSKRTPEPRHNAYFC